MPTPCGAILASGVGLMVPLNPRSGFIHLGDFNRARPSGDSRGRAPSRDRVA